MKKSIILLGLLIYFRPIIAQIYYKEIVYVFNYTIEKENAAVQKGIIYLGCLGKEWLFSEHQRQAAVIWTTNEKFLNKTLQTTGMYEEKDLIWIHPPREEEFSLLEYTPWPRIYFPVSNHLSWKTELPLGKYWVNEEFGIEEDDILKFNFVNAGPASYSYKGQKLECWKIEAESTNLKPQTKSLSLFNKEYGFVRMVFQNLDNSIITLELSDVRNWASRKNQMLLQ